MLGNHDAPPPLVVRLVKGAYWDHEIVEARHHGWPAPVFEDKADCDRNFETLTRRLLDARPLVRVAVASHNLRSVSHAIACNRALGAARRELEFQVLRGLGDDLQHALTTTGMSVRTYCPVGDLVAGMAYLIRRLLENTSNESFLAGPEPRHEHRGTAGGAVKPFANEPHAELRRAPVREELLQALRALEPTLPRRVPVWIGDEPGAAEGIGSTDPGDPESAGRKRRARNERRRRPRGRGRRAGRAHLGRP